MNEAYNRLKEQYDGIGQEILALHQKQQKIRDLMEQVCTHERLVAVDRDPFELDAAWDEENEEARFKCKDCYRYFNKQEAETIKTKK